jgi:hypothetical protein
MSQNQEIPIACDFDAIPANERKAHTETAHQLFAAAQEVAELSDGYGFRLPAETQILRAVTDFIANERLCCPFFRFEVVVEPQSAAIWLRLRGAEDVKAFVRSEVMSLVSDAVLANVR